MYKAIGIGDFTENDLINENDPGTIYTWNDNPNNTAGDPVVVTAKEPPKQDYTLYYVAGALLLFALFTSNQKGHGK